MIQLVDWPLPLIPPECEAQWCNSQKNFIMEISLSISPVFFVVCASHSSDRGNMALLQDFESFNQSNFNSRRDPSTPSVENVCARQVTPQWTRADSLLTLRLCQLIDEIASKQQEKPTHDAMFEMIPVECKPVTSQGLIDMVRPRRPGLSAASDSHSSPSGGLQ